MSDSCDPMDPPDSSVHRIFQEEYWSGLPFPSPGDISDPGIEPGSPPLQAVSLLTELPGKPQKGPVSTQLQAETYTKCL